MAVHGLFFAPVTPALIEVMGKWYDKEGRGMIMGFWAANDDFGIIIGLQVGHLFLHTYKYSWETYFYLTGSIMLFFGFYNLFFLRMTPEEAKLPTAELKMLMDQEEKDNSIREQRSKIYQAHSKDHKPFNVNLFNCWQVPKILKYTIVYTCLKCTFLGLQLWLPKYLDEAGMSEYSASIT